MTRSELKRLRAQVETLPPKAPSRVDVEAMWKRLGELLAMTPEELERQPKYPLGPEDDELLERLQRLAKLESRQE